MRGAIAAHVAVLALVSAAGAVAGVTVGCGKSQDDAPAPPQQLGFVPPPTREAPAPSATETATAAPAFTSYFSTLDSGGPAANAGGAMPGTTSRPAPRIPDPDVAASESLRSQFNGCFPQAHLARGTSRNISVTFTVIATGRVSRYDISGASAADGPFYDCLQNVASGASFPERSTKPVAFGPPPVAEVRTVVVTAGATAS